MFPITKPQQCASAASLTSNVDAETVNTRFVVQNPPFTIMMSDIESLHQAQYQLETTHGFKYCEVDNIDFHIKKEYDITSDDYDTPNVGLLNKSYESASVLYKPKEEVCIEFEMEHGFVNMSDEKFTIKEELLDVSAREASNSYLTTKNLDFVIPNPVDIVKEDFSDEVSNNYVSNIYDVIKDENHKENKDVCEVIKRKKHSTFPPINRTKGLYFNKEQEVVAEDVTLSLSKQNTKMKLTNSGVSYIKAQSINNEATVTQPTINNRRLTNTNYINADSTSTIKAVFIYPGTENVQSSDLKNTSKSVGAVTSKIDFTHHDEESSNISICDICNQSFQNERLLKQHIQRQFNCNICKYITCRKKYLTEHVNTKHNEYNCSYCDYKSYDRSNLSRHVNSKHTKNTIFNCSYCSYKAYDKSVLNRHVNSKHTKITVFECAHCDYKTCENGHLNRHMNSKHTKKSVYDCSYCSFKTYNKSNLGRHIKAKHNSSNIVANKPDDNGDESIGADDENLVKAKQINHLVVIGDVGC